jgi:hypothetical protein
MHKREGGMVDVSKPARRTRRKPAADAKSISALARSRSAACIDVLLEIASDAENSAATRVSAAIALLDRGWGKPVAMTAEDPPVAPAFGDLTLEQVIAARAKVVDDC